IYSLYPLLKVVSGISLHPGQVKEIGLRICRFLKVILKVSSNRQALQSMTETVFDCSACFS
ncbi:hypothetical protein ACUJ4Z_14765, partial [Lacticaseibacillus paracasei]|uniref:hypothetical protein n=1 Tax=Lacticaseibacillus paracasei TaxID=1597 RepID=UPI004043798C